MSPLASAAQTQHTAHVVRRHRRYGGHGAGRLFGSSGFCRSALPLGSRWALGGAADDGSDRHGRPALSGLRIET